MPNISLESRKPKEVSLKGSVQLGVTSWRGERRRVIVTPADRMHHLYMVGKTGVGKSTLYQNLMLQDMEQGAGCCFVDPHGEAIDWLLARIPAHRIQDVVLFDPSDQENPLGLNILEWKEEGDKDFLVSEAIQIFYKLFDPQKSGMIGPQFEHWMRNAALTVMADPQGGTLIEIPRLFFDKEFEKKKRAFVTDPVVQEFWVKQMARTSDFHRSEMLNYFSSKFGRFMTNTLMRNIIGQRKSSIDLQGIMDEGKILLVNLSKGKVGDVNSQMLGLILMVKLLIATLHRAHLDPSKRRPFYLYVDEFQNVLTDAFISMLAEARKYGLGVHLTHQYIAQLPDSIREAVMGNVGTLLLFQIGAHDASAFTSEFYPITAEDMQLVPRHSFYIKMLLDGAIQQPFIAESLPPQGVPNPEKAEKMRTLSRLRYGTPRELVAVE